MKKPLLTFLMASALLFAFAGDKLSIGTLRFLQLRQEAITDSLNVFPSRAPSQVNVPFTPKKIKPVAGGGFALPEMVNGVEMVEAFIKLKGTSTAQLESMGVIVNVRYDTFVTAKIPVDRIVEISELDEVDQIDVAQQMQIATDIASDVTNANKAWYGTDNGLCSDYDGSGVVVGVVDTGIDFQHIAFKDESGNTRIKAAYLPGASSGGSSVSYGGRQYTGTQLSSLKYDTQSESHGTHTSSTAGGSTVRIDDSHVYTGMAPKSDLVLVGCGDYLYNTYIANGLTYIKNYADSHNQPCVVNLSLGSQNGPHDGTGQLLEAYNSFTSNGTAKGRVICVATANDAGGNMYYGGTATTSTPAATSLEFIRYSDVAGTYCYNATVSGYSLQSLYHVWPRTSGSQLKFQFVVIDKRTKSIVATATAITPTSSSSSVSLGSNWSTYFSSASITVSRSQDSYSGKYCYAIQVKGTTTEDVDDMSTDANGNYISRYAVGMLVYSTSGTTKFDCWGMDSYRMSEFMDVDFVGSYGNYNFTNGSDECSVASSATAVGTVTVGAYVTRKTVETSNSISYTEDEYTVGDIASFSCYSTGCGPDGKVYPDIAAPGAILIAGVNRYDTSNYPATESSSYEYMTIINASDGSRYGSMSGTSMATPTATGIVALWLQANNELTVNDVKQVMQATAAKDAFTSGTNGAHFGANGKIDALAGLQYIAPCGSRITATPTELAFDETYVGATSPTKSFNVKGVNLKGNITLTLNDPNGVFTLNATTVTQTQAANGKDITVTFTPKAAANYQATVTLTSTGAEAVTVTLTGTGKTYVPEIITEPEALTLEAKLNESATGTFSVLAAHLTGNVTLTLNDPNNGFSLDKTTITKAEAEDICDVTVTFTPHAATNYAATITLASPGAESVTVSLTGKVVLPFVIADPEELLLEAKLNEPGTGKFTVMGENLTGNVTLTLGDPDGVFTLDKFTITKSQAESADGCEVNVTFTPLAMTDYNTTVTLSSPGAEPVTIILNGSPLKPYFIFEPEELTFNAATEETVSKTLQILAENIYGDVELSLDDPSGVFSLSTTSIPAAEAEDLAEVTITFYAENEGTYEGYLILTTPWGEEDEWVKLTAIANDGGTASDNYLNIAKYATIDTAGWNTTYVNKLYQYKDYEDTNEGWLTIPVYGAWVGVYYNNHPQQWIQSNVTNTSNKYAGSTWNSNAELLGSSVYFTGTSGNGSARAMGYNSRNNYTQETVTFYVTNTTAVKLLGQGQSRTNSTYPATLKVYECTKNDDGSLTASTADLANQTSSATSGTFVLTATGLDETKIYKVEAGTYRSYLCEIGFCTPLPETLTLRQLVSEGVEKKAYKIQDGNLRVVMLSLDGKKIYCKDENDYAAPSVPKDGEVDYSLDKAHIMNGSWDQSNWIALQLDNGEEWSGKQAQLIGYLLKNVNGKLKDKTNPVFVVNSKSLPDAYSNEKVDYLAGNHNVFITCNMVSTSQQGADGNTYFFVAPKPMEIAEITWAFWDGEKFTVPPYVEGQINELQFSGGFYVDLAELGELAPTLDVNHVYQFTGLIKREQATASRLNVSRDVPEVSANYLVYPVGDLSDVGSIVGDVITGVNDLIPGKTVKAMRYFDTLGRISTKPFSGINIIEVEYTDGTRQVIKKLLR
ncbi:MAG: S8 family serine peptidase [Muribaculaceae bacterium]|nr:S8 family serine peptidase [Muribaculaceae bacterium]